MPANRILTSRSGGLFQPCEWWFRLLRFVAKSTGIFLSFFGPTGPRRSVARFRRSAATTTSDRRGLNGTSISIGARPPAKPTKTAASISSIPKTGNDAAFTKASGCGFRPCITRWAIFFSGPMPNAKPTPSNAEWCWDSERKRVATPVSRRAMALEGGQPVAESSPSAAKIPYRGGALGRLPNDDGARSDKLNAIRPAKMTAHGE